MELHRLLGVRSNATRDEIKCKYYKQLFLLHPRTKVTGNEAKYIELQDAYKRFLRGDSAMHCHLVCTNDVGEVACRCGGTYTVQKMFEGKIDCEFCSCFIEVESTVPRVAG